MHYFIFPEKDTTIYQMSGSKNTGLDEILEIVKISQLLRIKIIISGIGLKLLKEATTLTQSMVETLRNRAFWMALLTLLD